MIKKSLIPNLIHQLIIRRRKIFLKKHNKENQIQEKEKQEAGLKQIKINFLQIRLIDH
jgi:hypothetical protein